jgi:protein-S-isoprenylcysteine O-methyltransferase Ste14
MSVGAIALALVIAWPVAEIVFARLRTARGEQVELRDRGSMGRLWIVIGIADTVAAFAARLTLFRIPGGADLRHGIALGLIVGGLALRVISIAVLGRFFTVNVALHEGHRVVRSGPYRWLRHPSYTGALVAFAGLGVLMGSWLSLAIILVPITGVFLHRVRVEEEALLSHLGDEYRAYARTTRRLIPFVY